MGPKLEGFARKILPLHRGRLAADEDFSFFGFNEVRVVRPTDHRHRSRTTATEQRQRRQEEALLGRLLACIHLSCGARAFDLSPRFVHCFTGRHRCHHPCPPRRRATASPPLSIKHFTSLRHVARTVGGGNCPPLPPSLPTSPRSVFTDIRSEWSRDGGRRVASRLLLPPLAARPLVLLAVLSSSPSAQSTPSLGIICSTKSFHRPSYRGSSWLAGRGATNVASRCQLTRRSRSCPATSPRKLF